MLHAQFTPAASCRCRMVTNLKYKPGGSQGKKIFLPAGEPAEGADGADVVLVCDPSMDNLLHMHKRNKYAGRVIKDDRG